MENQFDPSVSPAEIRQTVLPSNVDYFGPGKPPTPAEIATMSLVPQPSYRPFISLPIRFFPQWGYIAGVLDSTQAMTEDPAMKALLKKAIEYIEDNNIALHAAARVEEKV